jgi:Tfp pilus assembly protein PilX
MKKQLLQNEEGFVLIAALLVLLVLTVLGIAVNRNTNTEWRIALNERIHKENFYAADAAAELAQEVIEQNVACVTGFPANTSGGSRLLGAAGLDMDIFVEPGSLGFWRNYLERGDQEQVPLPTNTNRDLVFPAVFENESGTIQFSQQQTDARPHANIRIAGNTQLTPGSAIQMAAGYEGLGKGIGTGGATLVYDIRVVQEDPERNSIADIFVQYGHILGRSGACNYNN